MPIRNCLLKINQIHLSLSILIIFLYQSTIIFSKTLDEKIDSLLSIMSLEEKITQLHGEGLLTTAENQRLNIPGFNMCDGPHGVRDGYATAFPVSIAMAASWDTELIYRAGIALGREFCSKGKNQALAPSLYLTIDPRNGRNSESSGEDPWLAGQINLALTQGMQTQPLIVTAKPLIGENRQIDRHYADIIISERDLMLHHAWPYILLIRDADVMSIMSAYNFFYGIKSSQSHYLLDEILRQKLGYPYSVVSDWGAIWDAHAAITAGCDVCMGSTHYADLLLSLVESGRVLPSTIDQAVRHVLRVKYLSGMIGLRPPADPYYVNSEEHRQLALEIAQKSIILLKNENQLLPLDRDQIQKIAVIGPSADQIQLDGYGSSFVVPMMAITLLDAFRETLGTEKTLYSRGCAIADEDSSEFNAALEYARKADVVIYAGGLDFTREGEELDRVGDSLGLPGLQQLLIKRLAEINPNIIIVLESGGICAVENWIDCVPSLIYAFYPGQEGGNALRDIIFGYCNPCGKLPVTLPRADDQLPPRSNIYTDQYGYRYMQNQQLSPRFPFGYGLSYTTFQYQLIKITQNAITSPNLFTIQAQIINSGVRNGSEISQLYLRRIEGNTSMNNHFNSMSHNDPSLKSVLPLQKKGPPGWQLKGFVKTEIPAHATHSAQFELSRDAFWDYNETTRSFEILPGLYEVAIGPSSDSLPLRGTLSIESLPMQADLTISDIKWTPRYPMAGESIRVVLSVINCGLVPTSAHDSLDIELNIGQNPTLRLREALGAIPVNCKKLLELHIPSTETANTSFPVSGKYNIHVLINSENRLPEITQLNNDRDKSIHVLEPAPYNLALNQATTASSDWEGIFDTLLNKFSTLPQNSYEGFYAVDGNYWTQWISAGQEIETLTLNLGEIKTLDCIKLYWDFYYAREYKLWGALNGTDWWQVYDETNSNGQLDSIVIQTSCQYLRLICRQNIDPWPYSLCEFEVYGTQSTTKINELSVTGSLLQIRDNYPNPFNDQTIIRYHLSAASKIKLEIFDILGRLVACPINERQAAGEHRIKLNAARWKSGLYFYRIHAENQKITRRMLLIK